ncbi:MAG TPA: hypothetical protein VF928_09290 [Usitatibacteraceae bacterium]
MNFREALTEDRRLTILRLLAESAGYSANQYLLQTALGQFAHNVSMDVLRSDIAWLNEQGLVHAKETAGVMVPIMSERGLDVSRGVATVPGVKRPAPE